jgi:hypothetical protein
MVNSSKTLLGAVLFLSGIPFALSLQNQDVYRTYRELPLEAHLLIADMKLTSLAGDAQSQGNPERLKRLDEARGLLRETQRQYEFFATGPVTSPLDNRGDRPAGAGPGERTPALDKSPLSLLEHLHLFEEEAFQMSANIMVQGRAYSESESRRHQALGEAAKSAGSLIGEVEKVLGRARHFSSGYRVYFEAPLDYDPERGSDSVPVNLVKRGVDGALEGNVYITAMAAEYEISPAAWADLRRDSLRKRFPDLSGFVLEEQSGTDYEFRAKFRYACTADSRPVRVLTLAHKRGQQAILLICVAPEDRFNREEYDRIIASYYR